MIGILVIRSMKLYIVTLNCGAHRCPNIVKEPINNLCFTSKIWKEVLKKYDVVINLFRVIVPRNVYLEWRLFSDLGLSLGLC